MSRIRWGAAPVLVLLLPFCPTMSRPLMVLLALAFALSNATLTWFLHQGGTLSYLWT